MINEHFDVDSAARQYLDELKRKGGAPPAPPSELPDENIDTDYPSVTVDGVRTLLGQLHRKAMRSADQVAMVLNVYAERIAADYGVADTMSASLEIYCTVPFPHGDGGEHVYRLLLCNAHVAERVKEYALLQAEVEWVRLSAVYHKRVARADDELAKFRKILDASLTHNRLVPATTKKRERELIDTKLYVR